MSLASKSIGVMQGRLLPKYQGRYQAHPVGYWQDEFFIASSYGIDRIEFIFDFNDWHLNPLLTLDGVQSISSLSVASSVTVSSICADYFMVSPLSSDDTGILLQNKLVLKKLLDSSVTLGLTDIVIPCVDSSSISDAQRRLQFLRNIETILPLFENVGINFCLETDLNPQEIKQLINDAASPALTINYDIGNSASLGYNPAEEFDAYGEYITDVHVKDRVINGNSVVLGTGNADFALVFHLLRQQSYQGPLILQAYRDDQGLDIFESQLEWLKSNYIYKL